MFCPKCGLQNADETKFCRGCGTDLSNVLAVAPTTPAFGHPSSGRRGVAASPDTRAFSEKYFKISSSGIVGLLIGVGFMLFWSAVFGVSIPVTVIGFFLFVAIASYVLGISIASLVQSSRTKGLSSKDQPEALPPIQTEYIKPSRSIYETDDLAQPPLSVTEHTTRHLEMDRDNVAGGDEH